MKPLKEKVSITLDAVLVETIKRMAEEDDRSFSQYVNIILKRHAAETQNKQEDLQHPREERKT